MKRARLVPGWLLLLAAGGAQAHAHLQRAVPADGSVLDSAPAELVLTFSEAARLTALSIEKSGAAKQKLAPLPETPQARIVVALPPLTAGHYVVSWRALSADGHVVPGRIEFTLRR